MAGWFSTCTQPVRVDAHKFAPPSLTMIINGKLFDAVSPTSTRDSPSRGRQQRRRRRGRRETEKKTEKKKKRRKDATKKIRVIFMPIVNENDRINSTRIDSFWSVDSSMDRDKSSRRGKREGEVDCRRRWPRSLDGCCPPMGKGRLIKEALNSGFRARTTVEWEAGAIRSFEGRANHRFFARASRLLWRSRTSAGCFAGCRASAGHLFRHVRPFVVDGRWCIKELNGRPRNERESSARILLFPFYHFL